VSGQDLNAVSVPTYMIKSVCAVLRILGDVPLARPELRAAVKGARDLANTLERLSEQQSFPEREDVVAKGKVPSVDRRLWRSESRATEFRTVVEKDVQPAFKKLDDFHEGRGRFQVVLTFVKG
jgi:hypothetical protein